MHEDTQLAPALQAIVDAVKQLSLTETAELVTALEAELGITINK